MTNFQKEVLPPLYFFLLSLVTTVCSSEADMTVSLDEQPDHNDNCGRVYDITTGNKTTITATGRVHKGACGVTFRALSEGDTACSKICVALESTNLETCQVKMKFTGIIFSGLETDKVKEYDCRNPFKGPWCPRADLLQVYVIESDKYTMEWKDRKLYSFNVDIYPVCKKQKVNPVIVNEQKISDKYNKETEEREYRIKLEGIVVGVCLALIFLVVMGVMCCYYRAKQEAALPPDQRGKAPPIFSTIKTKILGNKRNRSMSSEPVQTEETYEPITDGPFGSIEKRESTGSAPKLKSDIQGEEKAREISSSAATLVLEQETKLLAEQKV